VEKFFFFIIY
jgi:hypothetical protein